MCNSLFNCSSSNIPSETLLAYVDGLKPYEAGDLEAVDLGEALGLKCLEGFGLTLPKLSVGANRTCLWRVASAALCLMEDDATSLVPTPEERLHWINLLL